ncbi:MAG TPA: hypothetical protein DE314_14090 [Sulfitobacter sp.]|nr:hypothetical protein [Sulfitobacter sp.]
MSLEPIEIWQPSLRAFGLRCCGVFLVTFVMISPVWPFVGGTAAFAASIALCVMYMFFVLDDFASLAHRKSIWTLTPNELVYENNHEDMEERALPLSEITSVHQRFLWNVQLRLRNGTAVTMFYLNNPKAVCETLHTAVASEAAS